MYSVQIDSSMNPVTETGSGPLKITLKKASLFSSLQELESSEGVLT